MAFTAEEAIELATLVVTILAVLARKSIFRYFAALFRGMLRGKSPCDTVIEER